ncbi:MULTISPECIES: MBL fold metallo-hydrolase [unclassified Sphingopyxis]|jgi:sulfur dioxygenase|uniref:MBL fold metallo-hydrolase n=1 Tax=Sphingomonadales TaxID=204457 RepID=UPI0010F6F91B|nr:MULTISPECIES: MBL fold metallo-hydrolase [unclassified Sphingopyxis]MBR2172936.1 MBL fold metallo-hydrolase [Sphingopyxis sp.]MDT7529900.1 MBL fold metallo-hydrolase [Sphingopyxis sp. SE2]
MIFRQLFEPESSTYTYLIGCRDTGKAVLLDPVLETVDRDLAVLQELELTLEYTLETHIHADHVTSACRLRSLTGSKVAYPAMDGLPCADVGVGETDPLSVGSLTFQPLFTPGHTNAHHSYLIDLPGSRRVFTGDALLIDGCGRTDFQNGDAGALYRSIHEKIFSLPCDTLVYPAHDYQHRHVTTVAQERERNARLGGGKTLEQFIDIMTALDLPYPKRIDIAVPANRLCGDCPEMEKTEPMEPPGPSVQG